MYMLHAGTHAASITFTNNCPYTVWPGTLTFDQKPQLSTTGFELASTASSVIDVQAPWKGRFGPEPYAPQTARESSVALLQNAALVKFHAMVTVQFHQLLW